jgi:hypothetical protein
LQYGSEWRDEYYIANCIGSQRLVRYLSPFEVASWELEEVTIKAKKVGNRTGVKDGATTWLYTLTGEGFTVQVRAVWHRGELMGPLKTHCRITKVTPDTPDARRAYNSWLRQHSIL